MKFSKTDNLLLNMMAGLEPDRRTYQETLLLKRRFGKDWFHSLGYTYPRYERHKSDPIANTKDFNYSYPDNRVRVVSKRGK